MDTNSRLPLDGLLVIEFAGLAPGPFAGVILADWGANVIRIDRADQPTSTDVLARGKRSLAIDAKVAAGRDALKRILSRADVVIDPFRPGVLEKLGLGPDVFLGEGGVNGRLVFARIAGFPRDGQLKDMAGHDINYLAHSGTLSMLPGTSEKPVFPLNILADFAGGGMTAAMGVLLALLERSRSGRGQVVNTDMVSGTRYLTSYPMLNKQFFSKRRGTNLLDGGAPFYDVYTCSDGGWMSVGCLEPQFFRTFIERFVGALPPGFRVGDIDDGWRPLPERQRVADEWPKLRRFIEEGFKTNTRDYWGQVFHGSDACAVPVLTKEEAEVVARETSESPVQPAPHPALSRTPATRQRRTRENAAEDESSDTLSPGLQTNEVLAEFGINAQQLAETGALGKSRQKSRSKL